MVERMKQLVLSALAAFLFAGCGQPSEGVKRLTVGFDADFPPYGFKQGDEFVGFDLDLAKEVCVRRGWTFVANPINWDAKDMELGSGAIDCIWNGFTINGREEAYTWSPPYIDNSQVVLVKVASSIRTLADLKGRTVAVQTDTPVEKALKEGGEKAALGATFKGIVVTPNYNNAVMELDAGAVDAIAMDMGVALKKLADCPGQFRILDEAVMHEFYGIGFKKGNVALRDQVTETLREMVADGTAAKISAKWFEGANVLVLAATPDGDASTTPAENALANPLDYGKLFAGLFRGLGVSIAIFVLTLLFALPLGLVICFGRMSVHAVVSAPVKAFISVMRGTPLMLQLFFVYFGPWYVFHIQLAPCYRIIAVIIAFALNYAAYFAEIYRAGLEGIERGQHEAASALGLGPVETFLRIVFPQMVKRVLPPVTNEVITLVKDTSLAFALSVTEMFTVAKMAAGAHTTMVPFIVAGVFYYVFNALVAKVMELVERRLSYYS